MVSFCSWQVGHILGAHGIKGEVKVRASTDFAVERLCTAGVKHIKPPNRRFPRDVELMGGRWQKEDVFILQFEVGRFAEDGKIDFDKFR